MERFYTGLWSFREPQYVEIVFLHIKISVQWARMNIKKESQWDKSETNVCET